MMPLANLSISELSKQTHIPVATLYSWRKQAKEKGLLARPGNETDEERERMVLWSESLCNDGSGRSARGVAVTDASVHDPQMMDELLHGEEKARLESQGVTCRIHCKARRGKKLTCAYRAFNRKSSRTRAKVEHIFGVVKHLWGYRKVRCRGIEKNASQVFTLMALANLYLCRKDLAA